MEHYNTWAIDDLLVRKMELENDNKSLGESITFLLHKDRLTYSDEDSLAFWKSQADLNREHIAAIDKIINERKKQAEEYRLRHDKYFTA